MIKEGRILKDDFSFLLLFKVSGDRLSFAKPHSSHTQKLTQKQPELVW
jgi:hypothetical protein